MRIFCRRRRAYHRRFVDTLRCWRRPEASYYFQEFVRMGRARATGTPISSPRLGQTIKLRSIYRVSCFSGNLTTKNIAWFGTFAWANDAAPLQFIHDFSSMCVAQAQMSLQNGRAGILFLPDEMVEQSYSLHMPVDSNLGALMILSRCGWTSLKS